MGVASHPSQRHRIVSRVRPRSHPIYGRLGYDDTVHAIDDTRTRSCASSNGLEMAKRSLNEWHGDLHCANHNGTNLPASRPHRTEQI